MAGDVSGSVDDESDSLEPLILEATNEFGLFCLSLRSSRLSATVLERRILGSICEVGFLYVSFRSPNNNRYNVILD